MDTPRQPTSLPQARRYTRKFNAPRNKTFGEQETFIINIPPIDKTYLTKNTKLHFDFELNYYESTSATLASLFNELTAEQSPAGAEDVPLKFPDGFFDRAGNHSMINAYTKPHPTLDINGAYGLIKRIRVYDFLGTTLLEDVQEHDVLTAMLSDFEFKDENMSINRPTYSDGTNPIRKPPCSFIDSGEFGQLLAPWTLATYPTLQQYATLPETVADVTGLISPGKVTLTSHYSLDLYSFLGKFSDKFVPLHNGFRIEFSINKASIPISFDTAYGGLKTYFNYYSQDPATVSAKSVTLTPWIESIKLSNIYLKCDLLELSAEMDKGIDKVVHYQGFKYQLDSFSYSDFTEGLTVSDEKRSDFTKRISPSYLSLTKVFIGQRLVPTSLSEQKLGFRVKNYLDSGELLYNHAVIQTIENDHEAIDSIVSCFQTQMGNYLTMDDFGVEEPETYMFGTGGYQFPFFNKARRNVVDAFVADTTKEDYIHWWAGFNGGVYHGEAHILGNMAQGKFLLAFDSRLPGTTPDTVGGIDTTKNILEYKIKSSSDVCHKVYIDVICQHDCLVNVEPGKSTTVSF